MKRFTDTSLSSLHLVSPTNHLMFAVNGQKERNVTIDKHPKNYKMLTWQWCGVLRSPICFVIRTQGNLIDCN